MLLALASELRARICDIFRQKDRSDRVFAMMELFIAPN